MRVDSANAEEQLGGDLPVGTPLSERLEHFHLATRELRMTELLGLEPADPAVDTLLNQAEQTINQSQSNALWAKADKMIMATGSVVPLVYNRNSFLRGSGVQNFYIGTFPAYPIYTAVSLGG